MATIKTYIADRDNKLHGISHNYSFSGSHNIAASDNAMSYVFYKEGSRSNALYKSISFGSNCIEIPSKCCFSLANLQEVAFRGNKVKSIGDEAFSGCTSLKQFQFPEQLEHVGKNAFFNCRSMTSITAPKIDVVVEKNAFASSGLRSIDIKISSKSSEDLFKDCTSLQLAKISGMLVAGMFQGCTALSQANVSRKIEIIPARCFSNCSSLKNISFSSLEAILRIEDNAFFGCVSLTSLDLQHMSHLAYIGNAAFSGSGLSHVDIPSSITSPSQLNPSFLVGSNVTSITFLGINSKYMQENRTKFTSFGANPSSLAIFSSDGVKYTIDADGFISRTYLKTYIISIALSKNSTKTLRGMYKDSARFVNMVDQVYSKINGENLIVGRSILNDPNMENPIGNRANINAAFDAAVESGAELLLFHFSDHGVDKTAGTSDDGDLCIYGSSGVEFYSYTELFAQFMRFKNVFAIFCCCYPNSAKTPFSAIDGNTTKALFWTGSPPNMATYMDPNIGHRLMTALVNTFNANNSWSQQFAETKKISQTGAVPYYDIDGKKHYTDVKTSIQQYVYNGFPVQDEVFTIKG